MCRERQHDRRAMGLARNSDIFKAGVDFHGVHDWAIFLPMWVGEVDAKNAEVAPDIKEARELAFKSSPVASIAAWRSPVLFVHGDDDRNVPFQQTTDLVEKLRAQKVTFEELIIPDEIHDLLRWSDWPAPTAPPPNSSTANWSPRARGNKSAAEHRDWNRAVCMRVLLR
jgi:dipeptidyl aminopeptidase/acylaminoacyl peptidase